MRWSVLVLVALFIGFHASAVAEIYQWVDNKGVVHFTDSLENVPGKYMNKVKTMSSPKAEQDLPPAGKTGDAVAPRDAAPSGPSKTGNLYGGHDEAWWRGRFESLRGELKAVQDALPAKRQELEQLRRKQTIYTYARNRVAYQDKLAEVKNDEARIETLNAKLSDLDTEASRAGVPFEWRK